MEYSFPHHFVVFVGPKIRIRQDAANCGVAFAAAKMSPEHIVASLQLSQYGEVSVGCWLVSWIPWDVRPVLFTYIHYFKTIDVWYILFIFPDSHESGQIIATSAEGITLNGGEK